MVYGYSMLRERRRRGPCRLDRTGRTRTPGRAHVPGVCQVAAALLFAAWVGACHDGRSPSVSEPPSSPEQSPSLAASPSAAGRCGDVTGAWSSVVGGLRGRLVTSGSRADGSALRVTVELQNVSGAGPLEIHWSGRPQAGFLTFRLDDAAGAEVPEPPWRLGGNEPGGNLRETIPPTGTVRRDVADNVLERFNGERILRIGAFWARQMPSDGSRRALRATVTGEAPSDAGTLVYSAEGGAVRTASPSDERGRVWTGSLELPAVCVQ